MPKEVRPRRSVLYMPGSNARALEKARTLAADGFIFDLEDAVAPEAKARARQQVVDTVQAGGYGKRERIVRVNALTTPWGRDDLVAVATCGADAVLLPKGGKCRCGTAGVEYLNSVRRPGDTGALVYARDPRRFFTGAGNCHCQYTPDSPGNGDLRPGQRAARHSRAGASRPAPQPGVGPARGACLWPERARWGASRS